MRRIIIVLAAGGMVVAAFVLYAIKYDTRRLELHARDLTIKLERAEADIAVLQAEWGHRTHPSRIERLARRHLKMRPAGADQLATLDEIPMRDRSRRPSPASRVTPSTRAR